MLHVFSHDPEVIRIGVVAFRFIGISFVPLVSSLTFPVFFQALGHAATSSILTIIRTVFLFIPLAYLFSRFGLVLADISGDGFHHDIGRILVLPEVQQKHAISCCGSVMKWQKNGYGLFVLWNKG